MLMLYEIELPLIDDEQAEMMASPAHPLGQPDPAYAHFRDQTRFWIQRVAVPMIMVVGLFGNLITVIIMTRRGMRSTTNMYLAALAFVDMLYLVLTFLLGLSHYPNVARRRYYLYWKLKPFLMMLTDSCSNTSVWLTVTFTIERFIAVRYPIKGKVWCTEARAKRLIVCVFLFAILFTLPTPFEWNVVERRLAAAPASTPQANANKSQRNGDTVNKLARVVADVTHLMPSTQESPISGGLDERAELSVHADADDDDQAIIALEYSDFGSNDTYKTIYYWSTAAIFYFIPLLSLTFFNGFLIHSVHQSRRERNKMTNQRGGGGAPTTPVYDRDRPPTSSDSKPMAANKTSPVRLKQSGNSPKAERLLTRVPSDDFPEVRFKVIGEPAGQDGDLKAGYGAQNLERAVVNNQQTDCDKRDRDLLGGAFVRPGQSATRNSAKSCHHHHHHDQPTLLATRRVTGTERAAESEETTDDATPTTTTTRLYLVAPDNNGTAALTSGSLKLNALGRSAGGFGGYGAASGKEGASQRSQLVPLDSSLTNNHSSCSSYNESVTPGHQTCAVAPASSHERRITIMLIAVVILFLVCQIPSAAMLLYTSVHETIPNTNEQALQLALGNIFNFLMAVNAAGNFILYSFLSKKYRRTFVSLFCGCLKRAPKKGHKDTSTRSKSSCYFSKTQQTDKNPVTINTSYSIADEASTIRWAAVRFSKVTKPPSSADTKRILIKDNNEVTINSHLISTAEHKRRDTLV